MNEEKNLEIGMIVMILPYDENNSAPLSGFWSGQLAQLSMIRHWGVSANVRTPDGHVSTQLRFDQFDAGDQWQVHKSAFYIHFTK